MKNRKLREYMLHNDISQEKLGEPYDMKQPEISAAFKFFENTGTELSGRHQQRIIEKLEEAVNGELSEN